jgi:hypothetical protein
VKHTHILSAFLTHLPEAKSLLSASEISRLVLNNGELSPETIQEFGHLQDPLIPSHLIGKNTHPDDIAEVWGEHCRDCTPSGPELSVKAQRTLKTEFEAQRNAAIVAAFRFAQNPPETPEEPENDPIPTTEDTPNTSVENPAPNPTRRRKDLLDQYKELCTIYDGLPKYVSTDYLISCLSLTPKEASELKTEIRVHHPNLFGKSDFYPEALVDRSLPVAEILRIYKLPAWPHKQPPTAKYNPNRIAKETMLANEWYAAREALLAGLQTLGISPQPPKQEEPVSLPESNTSTPEAPKEDETPKDLSPTVAKALRRWIHTFPTGIKATPLLALVRLAPKQVYSLYKKENKLHTHKAEDFEGITLSHIQEEAARQSLSLSNKEAFEAIDLANWDIDDLVLSRLYRLPVSTISLRRLGRKSKPNHPNHQAWVEAESLKIQKYAQQEPAPNEEPKPTEEETKDTTSAEPNPLLDHLRLNPTLAQKPVANILVALPSHLKASRKHVERALEILAKEPKEPLNQKGEETTQGRQKKEKKALSPEELAFQTKKAAFFASLPKFELVFAFAASISHTKEEIRKAFPSLIKKSPAEIEEALSGDPKGKSATWHFNNKIDFGQVACLKAHYITKVEDPSSGEVQLIPTPEGLKYAESFR